VDEHPGDLSYRRRDERLDFVVHDTSTVEGFLEWAATAPSRSGALRVARANIEAGRFSPSDVGRLIAAGFYALGVAEV
jgi:hypothetical protein